ncbi:MAG: hypothetical protein JXR45_15050 [Deltaproteobacteria bacterium]|nr:hypothetical protein [Deltaproteobacteria bacterium]
MGQPIGTQRSTSCDCNTVCEMREEIIIRELAQEEACPKHDPVAAKSLSPYTTEVGVAA